MAMQNQWELLLSDFLEERECMLVEWPSIDEEYDPCRWMLISTTYRQRKILSDRVADAYDVLNSMTDKLEEFYEELQVHLVNYVESDMQGRAVPEDPKEWLALRDDKEFYNDYKYFFDFHNWDFEVCDMLANHLNDIDLRKVY